MNRRENIDPLNTLTHRQRHIKNTHTSAHRCDSDRSKTARFLPSPRSPFGSSLPGGVGNTTTTATDELLPGSQHQDGEHDTDDARRIRRKLGPFFGEGDGGVGLWRGVRAEWGRAKRVVDTWELVGGTEIRADDDDSDVNSAVVEVDALTEAIFVRGASRVCVCVCLSVQQKSQYLYK